MDLGVPSDEEDRDGDIESEEEEEDGGSELIEDYDSVLDRRGEWDMGSLPGGGGRRHRE